MIHGKIDLKSWELVSVDGEKPESTFENDDLKIFFYGQLYNRDAFQATPDESNAQLAARICWSEDLKTEEQQNLNLYSLDGSFTIIYTHSHEAGVVRDHHGTHYPIYYTEDGCFSSSWQHLSQEHGGRYTPNTASLSTFLQRGIISNQSFIISDIHSLGAGKCMFVTYDDNELSIEKTIRHPIKVFTERNPDVVAYSRRYGELHTQAIRRRIGDSKRVGILLSGGYDSGSNLTALRSIYDGDIDSYTVGFKGDSWTELPMARLMANTFGTRHHEYEIDGSEINSLPDIIRFLGEPFVEGGLMVNYCAMRMIGDDKPDVILGGDGSDQYFGTSGREVALHYLTARAGMHPLLREMSNLLSHNSFDTGGKLSRINFHLDKVLHVLEGERFGFSDYALRTLLQNPTSDFQPSEPIKADISSFDNLYTQHALISDLEVVINRIILYKASRMASMFGNNLTFPFIDLDLYYFLRNLPVSLKCKGDSVLNIARGQSVSKYLLKYHYKPLLPEAITSKKKQGGFAPMPSFFRDAAQRARFKEFILSSSIMDNYLRRDGVEKFLTDYDCEAGQEGGWFWHKQNKALQYFNLLALVVWWEEFVAGNEVNF